MRRMPQRWSHASTRSPTTPTPSHDSACGSSATSATRRPASRRRGSTRRSTTSWPSGRGSPRWAFSAQQRDRLLARGIDIAPYELGHLAVRVPEWDQYVHLRTLLERHADANVEGVWNGRPMSMILLAEPLRVLDDQVAPLIELIPPVHQRVYKMDLEHLGVVVSRSA